MGTALVVFSSSTTASRLKKLAMNEQLRGVTMTQSPKSVSQNGCTYALRCPMNILPSLLSLADLYHVKHGQVYREWIDREGRKRYEQL
ncbi:MAG: DUF3343 domain-containing protein [Clostridia bacterium]|nr:DUF3343 domain-containing protein [Clostridia bacterium]